MELEGDDGCETKEDEEEKKEEEKEVRENGQEDEENDDAVRALQKKLDDAYLKQEAKDLEYEQQINKLTESNKELTELLHTEQANNRMPSDPSKNQGSLVVNAGGNEEEEEDEQ